MFKAIYRFISRLFGSTNKAPRSARTTATPMNAVEKALARKEAMNREALRRRGYKV